MILDQLPPLPIQNMNRRVSLDTEIERQTAVMVLTGCNDGLSHAVEFDGIRSQSLPLERDDEIDSAKIIRVSLKTAVHFIAEMQQREERAFAHSKQDTLNFALDPKPSGFPVAMDEDDDEYVNRILENPADSENESKIRYALWVIKKREEGEEFSPDLVPHHWQGTWI